ncbi:hypothetical protein AB1Y20_020587 [Prymnesium parvum]|uniref:tRNA(Phe) 7-[(3-amino-3-carboxypropyl)-4-demethylwyosine(37)-N(4)]-methyltransferase n=1 Tax=Prymnesium parvum TaxID=97485 RepID=A0AB34JXS8_PRYPA
MADSRAKQPPPFALAKTNVLHKLLAADKSPKGSLDAPIAHLVHAINAHDDYVSTSCCSGRLALFAAPPGARRGGRWLLVRHAAVEPDELARALEGVRASASGPRVDGEVCDSLVTFKLEPPILHILCRDVAAAKRLLHAATSAGFRESGIVLSNSSKVMLAIRSTANSLELPVATASQPALVGDGYLAFLAEYANGKYEANLRKIDAMLSAFREACMPACVPCAEEQQHAAGSPSEELEAEKGGGGRGKGEVERGKGRGGRGEGGKGGGEEGNQLEIVEGAAGSPATALSRAPAADGLVAAVAAATATRVKHFINLTNGLEALRALANECGVPRAHIGVVRIQSSHCEVRDVAALLGNLDHSLLLHLALGFRCRVYDFGSRRKRWEGEGLELYVPSAIWWGLEIAKYALARLWELQSWQPPLLHGHDAQAYVDAAISRLPKSLSRKLKYYRAFVATRSLHLEGVFASTSIDGRRDLHAEMAWTEIALDGRPLEGFTQAPATAVNGSPSHGDANDHANDQILPLPTGMTIFDAKKYMMH